MNDKLDLYDPISLDRILKNHAQATKHRKAVETQGRAPSDLALYLIDGAIIVVILLCFLALLTWLSTSDINDAVQYQKERAERLAATLKDCQASTLPTSKL